MRIGDHYVEVIPCNARFTNGDHKGMSIGHA
jgi:hypothetical protein